MRRSTFSAIVFFSSDTGADVKHTAPVVSITITRPSGIVKTSKSGGAKRVSFIRRCAAETSASGSFCLGSSALSTISITSSAMHAKLTPSV